VSAFHSAFFVRDLASTRRFYGDALGCFGNQVSVRTTGPEHAFTA
jgi:extradiol dioxygenase family protein